MSQTEEQIIGDEAVALANELEALCLGHRSTSVLIALSMMIGNYASMGEKPDFHGLMRLISEAAFDTFRQKMRERRDG